MASDRGEYTKGDARMRRLVTGALAVAWLLTAGRAVANPGAEVTAGKGEISGLVVDSAGQAISAFTVEALAEPSPPRRVEVTQVGDRHGTFRLAVPAGTYVLSIQAWGYRRKLSWPIAVKGGERAAAGRLVLEPGGVVHGIVTDGDGRPIAGAGVGAVAGAAPQRSVTVAASSDEAGRFELRDVKPGAAMVAALHERYASSTPVEITVDPRAGNGPIALILTPGGRIEGVVRGRHGASAKRVLARDALGGRREAPLREDGTFTLEHVTPGANRLELFVDQAGAQSLHSETVTVREGETASPSIVFAQVALPYLRATLDEIQRRRS